MLEGRAENLESRKVIKWLPVSVLFFSMLISSILTLQRTPVETLIVFRNLTTLGVAGLDRYFSNVTISNKSLLCILLMIAGAIQYGNWDIHFDQGGYFWAIVCSPNRSYLICGLQSAS